MASTNIFIGVSFLICLWTCGNSQDLAQIAKSIIPDIRRTGESGKLNCTVTRVSVNTIVYWIRKRDQLLISKDDQIVLPPNLNNVLSFGDKKYDVQKHKDGDDLYTYTLHIRKLTLDDAGSYTCKVKITGLVNQEYTKDGEMVVLLPPSILKAGTTQSVTAIEGDDVTLMCVAEGFPKPNITWVRTNRKPLPPPYNRISYKNTTLSLKRIKSDAMGVYRCLADNNVRPFASHYATLNIQFRPVARPVQTTYGQAQGRQFDVVMECIIAGFPQPDLQWFQVGKDGEGLTPITDDDKHNINIVLSHGLNLGLSEYWFQLVIINVQGNDYGTYVCEGKNDRGVAKANILLYETSECQGANCPAEGGFVGTASTVKTSLTLIFTLAGILYYLNAR